MPSVAADEPLFQNPPMRSAEKALNGEPAKVEPKVEPKPSTQDTGQAVEIAKAQLMAQLAGDPEISKILQARNAGKKVSVVDPDEKSNQVVESHKMDWEGMNNSQLVENIPKVLLPSVQQAIKEQLEPLLAQVSQLQNGAQQNEQEKIKSSIETTKQKFSDFEDYRASMISINKETPGLGVEDLYWLAKARKGDFVDARIEPTSTARPSNVAARPSLAESRKAPLATGRRGASQMLDEALSAIDWDDLTEK